MNVYRMLMDDFDLEDLEDMEDDDAEDFIEESGHITSFETPVGEVTLYGYVTEDGVSLATEDVPLFHPVTGEPLTFVVGVAPCYSEEIDR